MAHKWDRSKLLIIHVRGGVVQDVENTGPINYDVWDHDNCDASTNCDKCPDCRKEAQR